MLDFLDDSVGGPPLSIHRAGDRVAGKYTLLRRLGAGGMGEVWAAQSDALDSKVAIKLIHWTHRSATGQRRLLREARATAKLVEPSIVRVFDFGTTEHDEPFIVMEFLDGEDLAVHLRAKKCLPATEAIRLLLPIVRALTVAHAAAIIHRDVKPENVFLAKTATGGVQPKLLDFGIAQLGSAEHLTGSGSAIGSPEYMSPEQARGDEIDASTDTWALSVVLYEAITGASPFFGRNYNSTIQNILTNAPPPWPDFGEGSAELWEIVKKGLEKNPADRFKTSRALGRALAAWLSERGVTDDLAGVSLSSGWGEHVTRPVRVDRSLTVRVKRLARTLSPVGLRLRVRDVVVSLITIFVTAYVVMRYATHAWRSNTDPSARTPSGALALAHAATNTMAPPAPGDSVQAPPGDPRATNSVEATKGDATPAQTQSAVPTSSSDTNSRAVVRGASKRPSQSVASRSSKPSSAPKATQGAEFRNPFD